MTPEEKKRFEAMERLLQQIKEWMEARKKQQLAYPLDEASKAVINEFNNPL